MTFSTELWDSNADVYGAILSHPFITGLTDGTLPESAFAHFVVQDAIYLRDYARALAVVASRAPDSAAMQMFARHAADAVAAELELHAALLPELGISPADVAAAEPSPACLAYTSYLLATARGGSYAEGVGVVLPCYWIYWEVGKELVRRGSPDARFQRWIDTYSGDEFAGVVRDVIAETDRIGAFLSGDERAAVARHYRTTSRYEWMFWDSAYRQESWPVLCEVAGPRLPAGAPVRKRPCPPRAGRGIVRQMSRMSHRLVLGLCGTMPRTPMQPAAKDYTRLSAIHRYRWVGRDTGNCHMRRGSSGRPRAAKLAAVV
jgi:thiaminase (transcriptional activator TenA)